MRRDELSRRRKSRGLSQEALAYRLGVDRSTVARWEAGTSEPVAWIRPKLAQSLELTMEQLDPLLTTPLTTVAAERIRPVAAAADPLAIREQLHSIDQRYDTSESALTRPSKSRAIVLGNLALTYLRQNEVEEAVWYLHQTIDLVQVHRGGGGVTIAFEVGRGLRPWRQVASVDQVRDRLLGLFAGS